MFKEFAILSNFVFYMHTAQEVLIIHSLAIGLDKNIALKNYYF